LPAPASAFASRRDPCRLPAGRFDGTDRIRLAPLVTFAAFHEVLRSRPADSSPRALRRGHTLRSAPPMRFRAPSTSAGTWSPLTAALPQPLRSDLAVSRDLAGLLLHVRPGCCPGNALGVLPYRVRRLRPRQRRSRRCVPSCRCRAASRRRGMNSVRSTPGGCPSEVAGSAGGRFPDAPGLRAPRGFLVRPRPLRRAAVGPRHTIRLPKSTSALVDAPEGTTDTVRTVRFSSSESLGASSRARRTGRASCEVPRLAPRPPLEFRALVRPTRPRAPFDGDTRFVRLLP